MANQLATLILFPNRFQISGPYELMALTNGIVSNRSIDNEEMKYQVETLWSNWYVICAVTGDKVPLNLLKYWDVDLQEPYRGPDVVPAMYWTRPHDPRPELRDYWVKRNPERIASDVLEGSFTHHGHQAADGSRDNQG
jgi:hypothetical protein